MKRLKNATPPANRSITLYDQEGFQVSNDLGRFAVSNWMPFQYNPDGPLLIKPAIPLRIKPCNIAP
jgi:hypothetical protein